MGNCLGKKSSAVWAGDDWGSVTTKGPNCENEKLLGENIKAASSSSSVRDQVKIKITKRQLEELLEKVEVHDMPMDQVLPSLIGASDRFEIKDLLSWRPSLQSIPEVD